MWLRSIPYRIYSFFHRHLTTTVYVATQHAAFFKLIEWFVREYKHKNFRNLKINGERWGNNDGILTIGYGKHFIRYRKHIIYVYLQKEDAVQIAHDIVVNHWGSLIVRDEIDLPDEGYLDIDPMDINYTTRNCRTMAAFMFKYPYQ
jgi:hypothetical protein